jgi:hypothetical protein
MAALKATQARTERASSQQPKHQGPSLCVSPSEQFMRLQMTIGNQAVQRLVQERRFGRQASGGTIPARHTADRRVMIQREPLGRRGGPMKPHTVERGESLSLIAGYPDDGWEERLDQLIAANPDYPSIKNRTPDDPKYGWLEVADEINIPIELAPVIDPGEITCPDCRDNWESIVKADQIRALDMLDTTIAKLATYDGINPVQVKDALARRFKASSSAFATWINLNLRFLRLFAPQSEYLCQRVYYQCGGYCRKTGAYAWVPFCWAFTSIRVCDPGYFGWGDRERAMGLVHEWVHKYGCNFDFGYCNGSDCPGGTTRSLFNADPWARLVHDIG